MYVYCAKQYKNDYVEAGAVAYLRAIGMAGTEGAGDHMFVFDGDNAKNENPMLAPWAYGWRWYTDMADLLADTYNLRVFVPESPLAQAIVEAYPHRRYSFAGVSTNAG